MQAQLLTALTAGLVASGAQAQLFDFQAVISSGPQQATDSGSPATGTLFGTFDSDANTFDFTWDISDNLIGVPSDPGSHLHNAPAGTAGPIVFAFQNPDGTWPLSGSATWTGISQAEAAELFAGNIYANFHTDAFPAGEVRGQITLIPAPATGSLLTATAILAFRRRR